MSQSDSALTTYVLSSSICNRSSPVTQRSFSSSSSLPRAVARSERGTPVAGCVPQEADSRGDGRAGSSLSCSQEPLLWEERQGSRLGERTEAPRVALRGEDPSALSSVGLRQPFCPSVTAGGRAHSCPDFHSRRGVWAALHRLVNSFTLFVP